MDHSPDILECRVRVKAVEVSRIRAVQQISYVEGARGNSVEDMAVDAL